VTRPRTTVGVVPLEGRGSLPFVDLHREPLFLHAVRALLGVDAVAGRLVVTVDIGQREAAVAALDRSGLSVDVSDARTWWRTVADPVTVVVHDPLCPLVPASFLAGCLAESSADGEAVVAFRPVTDTIKTVVDGHIADTLDRDLFCVVASPVVFHHDPDRQGDQAREKAQDQGLDQQRNGADEDSTWPPTDDFGALSTWLRERGPVRMRKAPSLGRRVDDASAVNLLECLDETARSVRQS
jgi:2-C-methyl-D-erythritol 4-phosphate cytidylyltransferase